MYICISGIVLKYALLLLRDMCPFCTLFLQDLIPYSCVASYCCNGSYYGSAGVGVLRLPFVLLHIPVAPLLWVRCLRVCVSSRSCSVALFFRYCSLGLVVLLGLLRAGPWALARSLPLFGWDSAAFCSVGDYSWGCLLDCLASQGGNPPPYVWCRWWFMLCGYNPLGRKAHFELVKNIFLPRLGYTHKA